MSFVIAQPDFMTAAAEDLAGIRAALADAAAAAAGTTSGVAAAGGDEVSAAIAQLFGNFGQEFQAINTQASAFHAEFVNTVEWRLGGLPRD
jgi:PE family